jgi:predicted Holliday junction resolvase-like endonuclease
MFKFIIWVLVIFFVLRFVLRFVLPVFKITRMASDKMREMQQQMNNMQQQQEAGQQQASRRAVPKQGDYIDYEEVK